jgi:spermidine synthase
MTTNRRYIYFFIFALSGFSGLIYESIWTHYLKLFLGHAAYAQTLVLAIFMGGLAMGSWFCSKYSTRWRNLLVGYAVTEGIIGLSALIFHHVFDLAIQFSYLSIIPNLGSPAEISVFKWTLSALLILPQTFLLGMTFPLMTGGILRMAPDRPGRSISMLYFTNSLGAAIGVLASGFALIRLAGLPGTIRIAGLINIAIGVFVWMMARGHPVQYHDFAAAENRKEQENPDRKWYWFLLSASLITGTASFIYEIGWIRMLSLVLGTSTHAFELMLSAFILGLAFGGLWIQRRIDRFGNPVGFLVKVQIAMGITALSTLFLYGNTFEVMQWILKKVDRTDTGYAIFNLSSNAIALAIMFPATFCAGMTLPLITYSLIKRGHGERSIGAVYAANTVGAIIGVFFAIHFGMPLLGLKGLLMVGGSLDIALGLALLWGYAQLRKTYRVLSLATAACVAAIVAIGLFVKLDPYKMGSGVFRHGILSSPETSTLVFHKDGKTATVSSFLIEGRLDIRTNGKPDASIQLTHSSTPRTRDETAQVLLAAIPMALNPEARTVAAIGFGSGLTTTTLLYNSKLTQVDTVEIEPLMVEAAKNFGPLVGPAYTDPRSKIYIDDAKTFFSAHNKKYDIIISEPSNPWVSGVAGLFSDEFYRMIRRHMTYNGLFCQWLQLYEINVDLVVSVLKALSSNFTDFVVYAANDSDLVIVAGNGGALSVLDFNVLATPKMAQSLMRIRIGNIQDLEIGKIGDKKMLGRFLEAFPIRANSDYSPVLDQNAARARFLNANARELVSLATDPLPTAEMLMNSHASWESTLVSPSPDFTISKKVNDAMRLLDYFLHGRFSDRYWDTQEDIRKQAAEFSQIFFNACGADPEYRLMILYDVALAMAPYLHPNEFDAVMKKVESGACADIFTATERQWISLFRAVGLRDARAMASISRSLLAKAPSTGAMRYLLAAGMLGSVVEGERDESLHLWRAYQSRVFETGQPALLFRLLIAHSSSQ